MKKLCRRLPALFFFVLINTAAHAQAPAFGGPIDCGEIDAPAIREASGLVASRQNAHVLWTHNDSGDKNVIYAINDRGKLLGAYTLARAYARDWEDIAIGPGPEEGKQYIYVGDLGNNETRYRVQYIFRVPEPAVSSEQAPVYQKLDGVEGISFMYPERNYDAETLMLDPLTKDLYVVTKRDSNVIVFRAPYPQSTTEKFELEQVGKLPFAMAVAGDISAKGDEILIKTYDSIYYWKRGEGQTIAHALAQPGQRVPYFLEPQGEAVAWKADGEGYYTLSEERFGIEAHLYFYPRLKPRSNATGR
jgi:hypothetical protein